MVLEVPSQLVLHGTNSTELNLFHHGETTYRVGWLIWICYSRALERRCLTGRGRTVLGLRLRDHGRSLLQPPREPARSKQGCTLPCCHIVNLNVPKIMILLYQVYWFRKVVNGSVTILMQPRVPRSAGWEQTVLCRRQEEQRYPQPRGRHIPQVRVVRASVIRSFLRNPKFWGLRKKNLMVRLSTEFPIPSFIEVFRISFREFPRLVGCPCS